VGRWRGDGVCVPLTTPILPSLNQKPRPAKSGFANATDMFGLLAKHYLIDLDGSCWFLGGSKKMFILPAKIMWDHYHVQRSSVT
jgi:hypothetical protein